MSINPSDDFNKISKVFNSFENARKNFILKNTSLHNALLSKLQGLVDKKLLSPSGNSAVSEIIADLNSLKGKKLKDLTQDQDLVQIALSLTGQQKHLKPKSDFQVFRSLFDNFIKIASERKNFSKSLQESFFPLLEQGKKLLQSKDSKRALDLIKSELAEYGESKIEDLEPGTPSFQIIVEILKKHLVMYQDEGFVSLESQEDPTSFIAQLGWKSKEERLKSHQIFRSILTSSFDNSVEKALLEGYCGDQKNIEVTKVRDGECKVRFKDEFEIDLFYNEMMKPEADLKIKGRNYPSFSVFNADHVLACRRSHLAINFNEDQGSKTFFIKNKETLGTFILEAAKFSGFNPSTNDHKMLFLALLNSTTQTNGNLFFTKFKGIMSLINLDFMSTFGHYEKDLQESIQFRKQSDDSLDVSFEISDSFRLKGSPEEKPAIVTSVSGSYRINLSDGKIFLSDIDVQGRVFIPE